MIPLCISASWQIEVGELCAATLPEHARTNFNACQPTCLPSLLKVYCIWMCLVTHWNKAPKAPKAVLSPAYVYLPLLFGGFWNPQAEGLNSNGSLNIGVDQI